MKTCDVCHAQYSDEQGICPVCGYEPTGLYVGGAEDWKNEAAQYRRTLLGTLSTELVCYAHTAAGDTLVPEERRVSLSEAGALQDDGAEQWCPEPFCALPEGGTVTLAVHVLRGGAPCGVRHPALEAPAEHERLQLGIALEPGTLSARLLLKNSVRRTVSEPFALLTD